MFLFGQGHVDVFEKSLGGDALYAFGGFDEVVAGATGLFAAENIRKDERFGELTSAHEETGAIDGPLRFEIHECFFRPAFVRPAGGHDFSVAVSVSVS